MSGHGDRSWLRVGLMVLLWLSGVAGVWLAFTAAALPVLRNNETTLFVYDLIDDLPGVVAGVMVVGLAALVGIGWLSRSWKMVAWVLATGATLAVVGLVVGQVLFVPWVAK